MEKSDFKKTDKSFYSGKPGRFDVIEIPTLPFLMIDGEGDPNTASAYAQAVSALYVLSYQLKFHSKKAHQRNYVVGPLEGLWWADDMATFVTRQKAQWKWTMTIRQPEWFTTEDIETTRAAAIAKQAKMKVPKADPEMLGSLRFEPYPEGLCVQAMHLGSYDAEGPVLADLHNRFLPENGFQMAGLHHEIYLSDPRKVAPEKLKTILRQPVEKIGT